jgi:hypothetical protein
MLARRDTQTGQKLPVHTRISRNLVAADCVVSARVCEVGVAHFEGVDWKKSLRCEIMFQWNATRVELDMAFQKRRIIEEQMSYESATSHFHLHIVIQQHCNE